MRESDGMRSVTSEAGIIATLIHHPEFSFYSEQLLPRHFTDPENQCIYAAICDLVRRGITEIDAFNLSEALTGSEALRKPAEGITVERLQELVEISGSIARATIPEYRLLVDNVVDAAFRRDIYAAMREGQSLCLSGEIADVQGKIYELVDDVMTAYATCDVAPQFKDVVDDCWREIQSRQRDGYAGIPFKFPALNEFATIERGELFLFAGEAKQGKSIMLLNCAVDLLKKGYRVLYIDSELNTRLFTARILSHLSGVEYKRLTSGGYSREEEARIDEAREWLKGQSFTHVYMPLFDQESIYTTVKKTYHTQGIDVLIIDYFKGSGEGDAFDSYQELGRFVDKSVFTLNPLNCRKPLRAAPPKRSVETRTRNRSKTARIGQSAAKPR